MKKRTTIVGSILVLVVLLIVGGTMAWFTHNEEATNVFAAGTVEIQVNETYNQPIDWKPGAKTQKEVSIESLGSKQSYVRVALIPKWDDSSLPINNVELIFADDYADNWIYKDGWHYYKHILDGDKETSLLLKKVELKDETDDDYQGKTLEIKVKAEAVQASHEAYKEVWGIDNLPWGEEYIAP